MPLTPGSSRAVISENIAEMIQAGHPRDVAVAASLANARKGEPMRKRLGFLRKFEGQDRDAHGRFGSGNREVTQASHHLADALADKDNGGFSWRPDKAAPTSGFMCSLDSKDGHSRSFPLAKLKEGDMQREVKSWLTKELPFIRAQGEHYLGGWLDRDGQPAADGKPATPPALYLDVSERFTDKDKAVAAGKDRDQVSVYDASKKPWDADAYIQTGGSGKIAKAVTPKTGKVRIPYTRPEKGETDEQFGDRFADKLVKLVNEWRRERGMGPMDP